MKSPNFKTSKAELEIINTIADRAVAIARVRGDEYAKIDALMDVTACHCNGSPLRLQELAAADEFNFIHDVFGIRRHINHETGELEDHFTPRFAQRTEAA